MSKEIDPSFICKYCNKNALTIPSSEEWKMGVSLYYTLIEPLEEFVKSKNENRQVANAKINECDNFPNKNVNVDTFKGEIIDAIENIKDDYHMGSILYEIKELGKDLGKELSKDLLEVTKEEKTVQSEDILIMNYLCKHSTSRSFKYKNISFRFASELKDAMPDHFENIKGFENIKCDDYNNWLFYTLSVPYNKDKTILQIIGWNEKDYSLFFTIIQ